MDQELVIAMQIYMQFPEACKMAAASGSKLAMRVEMVAAGLADAQSMPDLDPAGTLADFDASKCVQRPR